LRGMGCTTIGNERFVATRCGGICILEACQVIEARDLTKPLPKLEIEIEIETNAEILSNPKPLQHGPPTHCRRLSTPRFFVPRLAQQVSSLL
jgi:hypothetical protein